MIFYPLQVYKTGKNQIEIPVDGKKTYILIEPDPQRKSVIVKTKSSDLDSGKEIP